MPTYSDAEIGAWYAKLQPLHEALGAVVVSTISSLLKAKKIDFLAITSRTKSLESVTEKVGRKGYADLSDVTDITGVRIISYIESDLPRISAVIEEAFRIHSDKSVDKSNELQEDRFGYRSVHYICELGDARTVLPELAPYKALQFEVQLRTVLQHAWAEIEHDRSYKFSGDLPSPIRRRLNLLSGVLELVDREFANLAIEMDAYTQEIKNIAPTSALLDEEVTSLSLREYFRSRGGFPVFEAPLPTSSGIDEGVAELKSFGVEKLSDFEKLLSERFRKAFSNHTEKSTELGFIRSAMLYEDIDRYFEKSWKRHWQGLNASSEDLLDERYGKEKVQAIAKKYNIKLLNDRRRIKAAVPAKY